MTGRAVRGARRVVSVLLVLTLLAACAGPRTSPSRPGSPRLMRVIDGDTVTTYNLSSLFRDPRFDTDAGRVGRKLVRRRGVDVALGQIREAEVLHRHRRHDLIVFLHRGRGFLETTGGTVSVRAGDGLIVPRGVPHRFVPTGTVPARALILRTPPPDTPDFHPVGTEVES